LTGFNTIQHDFLSFCSGLIFWGHPVHTLTVCDAYRYFLGQALLMASQSR